LVDAFPVSSGKIVAIDHLGRVCSGLVITLTELLWALIGLLLTIGGNFLNASIVGVPWSWSLQGIPAHFLGVSYQIGAVLFVGCMGGRNAGVISQVAYLLLGLANFQFFAQGGGLSYLREPMFGYLLGFLPGAWICGYLAFRSPPKLEWLAICCLSGLTTIHAMGILYLWGGYSLNLIDASKMSLKMSLSVYSGNLLPGQLALVCAVSVLAFVMRRAMFY
jgi:biotin transport system substrate-specific component